MCGIAGFSAKQDNRRLDARDLSAALIEQIVVRGPHATGAAWTDRHGKVWYTKAPINGYDFIEQGYLDSMDPESKTVILHTRYATKGSPSVEENNHPIVRPGIVGVHNGCIVNDDECFDLLNAERFGQVDSEAAFAVIAESAMHPTESLTLLDGDAALSWINVDDANTLHVARLSGRPLAIGHSRAGTFVFASTLPALQRAGQYAGLTFPVAHEVGTDTYLRARHGILHDVLPVGIRLGDPAAALVLKGGE